MQKVEKVVWCVERVHSIGRATSAVVGQGVCVWCEENVCSIRNVRLVVREKEMCSTRRVASAG